MKIGNLKFQQRQKTKTSLKRVAIIASLGCFVLALGIFAFINLSRSTETRAAVNGDYRTKASGNWNATSTWQKYISGAWANAPSAPTSTDGVITILNGHTVTITAAPGNLDQVVINSGGQVILNSGITMPLVNGTGTDFDVSGVFKNAGTVTLATSATIVYQNGGKYQHNYSLTAGTIPAATWNSGSICEVMAYTTNTSAPSGLQAFKNFIWNCPLQAGVINLGGGLTSIGENFTVTSTGLSELRMATNTYTLSVGGDYIQSAGTCVLTTADNSNTTFNVGGNFNQSGGTFKGELGKDLTSTTSITGNFLLSGGNCYITTGRNADLTLGIGGCYNQSAGVFNVAQNRDITSTINLTGDYTLSGGSCVVTTGDDGVSTFNMLGNFTQSSGTFNAANGSNTSTVINAWKDWTHTGGTFTSLGSLPVNVYYKKSGNQNFTASGNTIGSNVNFTVNSGSTLVMGSNILTGGNFTLSSGGSLSMGSANGITAAGTMSGNIQNSGTRSFSTGGGYIYNGSSAQVTGVALPSTVANLTVNNSSGLTLTDSVAVSGILTLTSGKITTGVNEISSTNTTPSGVTGHSSSSYIIGSFKRRVSGTGSYDFPIGTVANYEMSNVTLSGATGFTNIVASFTKADPLDPALPLSGIVVNALPINKLLNYGYWTITPNTPMTGGTYTVTLKEKGYTASAAAPAYCVLKRPNASSAWTSIGTHDFNLQTEVSGVVTSVRSALTSFSDFAIGYGEYLQWENPVLISGVNGQVGAIYKFPGVAVGVDGWVEIILLKNGATLNDIDYSTGGYAEAWQPFIDAAANKTSSILWKITYKAMGTSRDTVMPNLALTAIDVDGTSTLREFVEASDIYSYSVDPATTLSISYGTKGYRALGGTSSIPNIDTTYHHAMFQINHRNITSFYYETGIQNTSSAETRQFSLYFKFFMTGNFALPIKLASFDTKVNFVNQVELKWVTAEEKNNDYFTIERSSDGKTFEKVLTQKGAGNSSISRVYYALDKNPLNGVSYYRLKQTDFDGHYTYGPIESVKIENGKKELSNGKVTLDKVYPTVFTESFRMDFSADEEGECDFMLVNVSGQTVAKDKIMMQQGSNSYEYIDQHNLPKGTYFAILMYKDIKLSGKVIRK